MASAVAVGGRPTRKRRPASSRSGSALTPGAGLRARRLHDLVQPAGPDPALRDRRQGRRRRLVDVRGGPHQRATPASALELTVVSSLIITLINMVMGTIIAWVLVRDRFPGKALLDLVIDIPFAMPTIVAGLVLLSLYGPESPIGVEVNSTRWAVLLAIAFVTLPFVVRTVQPVLEELETDVEDAAASLGADPVHDVPPGDPAVAGAGDLRRCGAVLRPRHQ